MSVDFYPAASSLPAPEYQYKGRNINWIRENPMMLYDKMLISYYYGREGSRDDIGDHIKSVIGDSGGFQIMSQNVDISPFDVINWENDVCDIGFTLDIPPFNIKTNTFAKGKEFDKCMKKSNDNANVMMENKDENLKLYLVIQGSNYQERQRWLEEGTREHDDWDGYAISPKPRQNLYVLVDWLKFAIDNNLKNIHILGISGRRALSILLYFSEYFDNIKFDSSSYSKGSRYRYYYFPNDMSRAIVLTDKEDIYYEKYKLIPDKLTCDCPICKEIDDMKIFSTNSDMKNEAGELINMHNLYQHIKYIEFFKSLLPNPYLRENFLTGISKIIEYGKAKINGTTSIGDWI